MCRVSVQWAMVKLRIKVLTSKGSRTLGSDVDNASKRRVLSLMVTRLHVCRTR